MKIKKSHIALGSAMVMVMVCIIAAGLAAYGFVVDVATSPLASNIANANQKSFNLISDIERAYPAETVNIRFEDRHSFLTVTLVNSAANQLTTEEQKAMAAEIARLTWQNRRVNSRFIIIAFIERTRFLGIPLCHADSYSFTRKELLQE